jgi:hypothetical protein
MREWKETEPNTCSLNWSIAKCDFQNHSILWCHARHERMKGDRWAAWAHLVWGSDCAYVLDVAAHSGCTLFYSNFNTWSSGRKATIHFPGKDSSHDIDLQAVLPCRDELMYRRLSYRTRSVKSLGGNNKSTPRMIKPVLWFLNLAQNLCDRRWRSGAQEKVWTEPWPRIKDCDQAFDQHQARSSSLG